jgi:uncharacterized protein YegP (UPF0339 family)
MDTVHFYKDAAGEFRWRLQSENGRIVAESGEGYERLQSAIDIARDIFKDSIRYSYEAEDFIPVKDESPESA